MKYLFILTLGLITQSSFGQGAKDDSVAKEVLVKNWNEVAYFLPAGFWNESRSKELITQLGQDEFSNVKRYIDPKNIPCPFLIICNGKKKKLPELQAKLEKLRAYEIATFHHYNSSGDFSGLYSILMVPYKENEKWDSSAKWEKVYFLIKKDLVSEKKDQAYLNENVSIHSEK